MKGVEKSASSLEGEGISHWSASKIDFFDENYHENYNMNETRGSFESS